MGVAQVRHWARLLPLLLAWAAAADARTRAGALRALHTALRAAWPRLPAHARLIWRHLAVQDAPADALPVQAPAEDADPSTEDVQEERVPDPGAGAHHRPDSDRDPKKNPPAKTADPRAEAVMKEGAPNLKAGAGQKLSADPGPVQTPGSNPARADGEAARWAEAVAELLWWAGGEAFRAELRAGGGPWESHLRAHVLGLAAGAATVR